ncbi:MAG: hypothetical protein ACRDL5_15725 [Solirubrobacteraceae bacterium]
MNSTDTISGLLLDTGATLEVQSNGLTISGLNSVPDSALPSALDVASSASVNVGSSATLLSDSFATTMPFTNAGTTTLDYSSSPTGDYEDSVELELPSGDTLRSTGAIKVSGYGGPLVVKAPSRSQIANPGTMIR